MAEKLSGVAGKLNLVIEQGATFLVNMTWTDENSSPIDLTGYDARMDIKENINSVTPIITLSVTNTRIVLGGVAGTIQLNITDADTTSLTFSRAVYDLEMISSGGQVTRLLEGSVTLSDEVTTST